MKYYKLSILFTAITLIGSTAISCSQPPSDDQLNEDPDVKASVEESTPDIGQKYIDSFVFLGESTTYHMINRGVLSGGKNTTQVWGPSNGTLNLDTTISTARIIYPESGESISIGEAVSRGRPKYILLTFGLNGAVQKIKRGENYFKDCYMLLINIIRENSPNTRIIIQSAFPVAKNMDMSNYSVDAKTLNAYIDKINSWSAEIAESEKLFYLNTAEVLKDNNGFLLNEYQVGDGHHLTSAAYEEILKYVRTHPHPTEN